MQDKQILKLNEPLDIDLEFTSGTPAKPLQRVDSDIESVNGSFDIEETNSFSLNSVSSIESNMSFDLEDTNSSDRGFPGKVIEVDLEDGEILDRNPIQEHKEEKRNEGVKIDAEKTPSRKISLAGKTPRKHPSLDLSLGQLVEDNSQFFEGAWCYKKDTNFIFNIGLGEFSRKSEVFVSTGRKVGEGVNARLINFDKEFGGWTFGLNGFTENVTGAHLRIDQKIPEDGDYHRKPPFHFTIEFAKKESLHLRFDEQGKKVGREWDYRIDMKDANTREIVDAVLLLAEQFLNQVKVNKPAPEPLPLAPLMRHSFHHPHIRDEGDRNEKHREPVKKMHKRYTEKDLETKDSYRHYRDKHEHKKLSHTKEARRDDKSHDTSYRRYR